MSILSVQTPRAHVSLQSERLVVVLPAASCEPAKTEVLLNDLERAVFTEAVSVSAPALCEMLKRQIPVTYLAWNGCLLDSFEPGGPPRGASRLLQYQLVTSPAGCLAIAVRLVRTKISNARRLLQRVDANHHRLKSNALAALETVERAAGQAADLASLRGHEGAAATVFLIELMAGQKAFADKLDALFKAPPALRAGTYGKPIHEMIGMSALNMGQYAHGNEPVHHVLYLYDYVGQPWKTRVKLRQTMTLLYQATPDELCGDEDTGQMSAWFVFSALGFYPVCPGDPNYLIGSPLFDKATLHLPGGKTFIITAQTNGPQKPYIQSASLDGQPFDKTFISHEQIVNGGELNFEMGSAPNHFWGVSPTSRPPSPLASLLDM